MDTRYALVLICFALSGFAALLYETAWTREFAFVFGTSELATVSVLAAYMAGLAAGSAAAARWVDRVRRPVLVYGLLELGVAAGALAVPLGIRGATAVYVALFGGLPEPPDAGGLAGALFYLAASFAVLLPSTACMGATLPLLARHAVRGDAELGRRVGTLYAWNTAGAVAGALGAAFWLLPALGLRDTIHVGVGVNALVFVAAAALARGANMGPAPATPSPARAALPRFGFVLPLIALSGAVSFGYEVLWTRLLSHLLGGSVSAFATMLASFLLGIALGSGAAARAATQPARALRGFAGAQVGIATFSLAAYFAADFLPALAARLGAGAGRSLAGNAALAIATLVPPALCIGATFPFAVRALARDESEVGSATARVYAWNTLGSIAGAVLTGFLLLPALGFAGTLSAAAALNLLLAAAAWLASRPPERARAGAVTAGAVLVALLPLPTPWQLLRTSALSGGVAQGEIVYAGVGRSATVLLLDDGQSFRLAANGLPEAAIDPHGARPSRFIEARWLSLLPVLARPDTRSLLIVGLGGGIALESVPGSVDRIDAIELEPEVVAANRTVSGRRARDPLADPRVTLRENDARGALVLTRARWDAIVSQPSHPWTAGASHLYTQEFFEQVREHLTPDGVFVQWIGLAFVDEPLLRSLVATLLEVFPCVRVFQPHPAALLFAASEAPLPVEESAASALSASPADFARYGLSVPEDALAALVLDESAARRFAAGADVNRDRRNRFEAAGFVRRALAGDPAELRRLLAPLDPVPRLAAGFDGPYLVRRLAEREEPERAFEVARALAAPAEREAALGWIEGARSRPLAAIRHFEASIEHDPAQPWARAGRLLAQRERGAAGGAAAQSDADAGALERAVVLGWSAADAADREALRALEPMLAAAGARDPLRDEADRLRIAWRLREGGPERGSEALAIADALVARSRVRDLGLRVRAAAAGGDADATRAALAEIAEIAEIAEVAALARNRAQGLALAREGLALLDATSMDGAYADLRERFTALLKPGARGRAE